MLPARLRYGMPVRHEDGRRALHCSFTCFPPCRRLMPYRFLLLVAFVCVVSTAPAAAQSLDLGPRFGVDVDNLNEAYVGLDARINAPVLPVTLNPGFDVYFVDGGESFFTFDANLLVPFGIDNRLFTPYTGAGLVVTRRANGAAETSAGVQVLAGAAFGFGNLRPFVQAKASFGASPDLASISGGLLFRLGR